MTFVTGALCFLPSRMDRSGRIPSETGWTRTRFQYDLAKKEGIAASNFFL